MLCVLLFTLMVGTGVFAYPNGAPQEACVSLRPNPEKEGGHGADPRQDAMKYVVSCRQTGAGEVTMTVGAQEPHRGLLAQVRNGNTIVGKIADLPNKQMYKPACTSPQRISQGVTHKDQSDKRGAIFIFNGLTPSQMLGLKCWLTIVKDAQNYWVRQMTDVMMTSNSGPSGPTTPQPSLAPPQSGKGQRRRNRKKGGAGKGGAGKGGAGKGGGRRGKGRNKRRKNRSQ